jgi:hypothetical protein
MTKDRIEASTILLVAINIKENGKVIWEMEMEFIIDSIKKYIKDNGRIIWEIKGGTYYYNNGDKH